MIKHLVLALLALTPILLADVGGLSTGVKPKPQLRGGGYQTGPTGFDPRTVPGMVSAHEAFDASTLTLSGASVNSWADKTGHGWTLAPASSKPTYSSTGMASAPAVIFSRSDNQERLETASNFILANGDPVSTTVMVIQVDDLTIGMGLWGWGKSNGGCTAWGMYFLNSGANANWHIDASSCATYTNAVVASAPTIVFIRKSAGGLHDTTKIRVNGVEWPTLTTGGPVPAMTAGQLRLGWWSDYATDAAKARYGAFYTYDNAISDVNVVLIEAYLNNVYHAF